MRKWFVIVASVAVLLTLARLAGFRQIAATWSSLAPGGIALSVLCYYASILTRIASWRILLGEDSPPAHMLAPPLALGFVLGHVAPAKSGEPVIALLVSRNFALPLARTLSVLTAERALQLVLLLATFVPAAALTAGALLELRGTVLAASLLLAALLAGLFLAGSLLERLQRRALRLPRWGDALAAYLEALRRILSDRRRFAPLLALGTLFWLCQYLSLWAILRAGDAGVSLPGAAVVAGAAILGGTLSMLPLGTQDGISAVVLKSFGVPLARGFSLALFHTLLSLVCGLILLAALPLVSRRRG